MPQLVDHGLADLLVRFVAASGNPQDRAAENGDLVGHQRHPVRALRQRRAAVDAEELAVGVFEQIEIGGAVLDPEGLAYRGQQGRPKGTLVFDVELLKIK